MKFIGYKMLLAALVLLLLTGCAKEEYKKGLREGHQSGVAEGYKNGYQDGYNDGMNGGPPQVLADSVFKRVSSLTYLLLGFGFIIQLVILVALNVSISNHLDAEERPTDIIILVSPICLAVLCVLAFHFMVQPRLAKSVVLLHNWSWFLCDAIFFLAPLVSTIIFYTLARIKTSLTGIMFSTFISAIVTGLLAYMIIQLLPVSELHSSSVIEIWRNLGIIAAFGYTLGLTAIGLLEWSAHKIKGV